MKTVVACACGLKLEAQKEAEAVKRAQKQQWVQTKRGWRCPACQRLERRQGRRAGPLAERGIIATDTSTGTSTGTSSPA